jgi:hypothetical protein
MGFKAEPQADTIVPRIVDPDTGWELHRIEGARDYERFALRGPGGDAIEFMCTYDSVEPSAEPKSDGTKRYNAFYEISDVVIKNAGQTESNRLTQAVKRTIENALLATHPPHWETASVTVFGVRIWD